jgi:hypothetical protein
METGVGGLIQGISLGAFLQMVQMERKTCTLTIRSDEGIGRLYILNGDLIAAETENNRNKEAAYEIIGWDQTLIEIDDNCAKKKKEINQPLMHLLMEGLKAKDEGAKKGAASKKARTQKKGKKEKSIKIASSATAKAGDSALAPDISVEEDIGELSLENEEVEAAITPSRMATDGPPPPPSGHSDDVPVTPVEDLPLQPEESPADGDAASAQQSRDVLAKKRKAAEQLARRTQPQREAAAKAARLAKKKRLRMAAIAAGAGIVVLVIAIVAIGRFNTSKIKQQYDDLIARVEASNALVEKEDQLLLFIEAHPSHPRLAEVEKRLTAVQAAIEKTAFEDARQKVDSLPVDDAFEKKAREFYESFLREYPESPYVGRARQAIKELPLLQEQKAFESLKKIEDAEDAIRIEAYSRFLSRFPDGAHHADVKSKIADMSTAYHAFILREISRCDASGSWNACIQLCDEFITMFAGTEGAADLSKRRKRMRYRQELADLDTKAQNLQDDPAAALALYSRYLQNNPGSSEASAIRSRIDEAKQLNAEQTAWRKVSAYARDDSKSLDSRLRAVDRYIDATTSNRYIPDARSLREGLASQKAVADRQQRELARQRQERQQQEKERQARTRLAQATSAMASLINRKGGGRFKASTDGMVKDTRTGLIWTVLDSRDVLNRCVDHAGAIAFVDGLTTGGRRDWRLPRTGELVGIYKNKPFFPAQETRWYWSADVFTKGYHRIADVVTSKPETAWTRQQKELDKCGSVRAVRP